MKTKIIAFMVMLSMGFVCLSSLTIKAQVSTIYSSCGVKIKITYDSKEKLFTNGLEVIYKKQVKSCEITCRIDEKTNTEGETNYNILVTPKTETNHFFRIKIENEEFEFELNNGNYLFTITTTSGLGLSFDTFDNIVLKPA